MTSVPPDQPRKLSPIGEAVNKDRFEMELRRYAQLRDEGLLSDEEFQEMKKDLLRRLAEGDAI